MNSTQFPPVDRKPLGPFDAVGLIVGIIIGAGVFTSPPKVFLAVDSPLIGMLLWVFGALVALCGALCYAELAACYPHDSGEGEYFRRAYGPAAGWFFAWVQLVNTRTAAAVVSIAYVFADYAARLHPAPAWVYVCGAIIALTGVNALGLIPGKRTQNVLAAAKMLALATLIAAGFAAVGAVPPALPARASTTTAAALIAVFYTYAGWHEAAYIVTDLREPRRSLPWAMRVGIGLVAIIYLAVNSSALIGLGFANLRDDTAYGQSLVSMAGWGTRWFSAIVILVTLGSINGTILSGGRLFAAVGATQPGYGWLARGVTARKAPLAALAIQAIICLATVAAIESSASGADGFERVLAATSPALWAVFLFAGIALIVLRRREPNLPRPYVVPLYPVLPGVFILSCAFMLYESFVYAAAEWGRECWLAVGLLAAGVPYWWWSARRDASARRL